MDQLHTHGGGYRGATKAYVRQRPSEWSEIKLDKASRPPTEPGLRADPAVEQPLTQDFRLRALLLLLFFFFGGIKSLNDLLAPTFKTMFDLNYSQTSLVQVAFFLAYAVVGIPAGQLIKKIGYLRAVAVGASVMAAGCLIFVPASSADAYTLFLVALFVLASGLVIAQLAINPLMAVLGPKRTIHSRLSFAQAFQSLGGVLFSMAGGGLILGVITTTDEKVVGSISVTDHAAATQIVMWVYLAFAALLALVAIVAWSNRHRLQRPENRDVSLSSAFALMRETKFRNGVLCLFLYVGADVTIGSLIVIFVQQPHVLGPTAGIAVGFLPYYWGGNLVGRFAGAGLLRRVDPGKLLFASGLCALLLLLASSAAGSGSFAAWSMAGIGLANSIMFPTIFGFACDGLDERLPDGVGLIGVAIVGGAVVPLLTGGVADMTGSLALGLMLPAGCYAFVANYGWRNARRAERNAVSSTASQ